MSRGEPESEAMEAADEWVARMLKDDVLVAQMLIQLFDGKPSSSPPLTSRPLQQGRTRKHCLPLTASLHGWCGGSINEKAMPPLTIVESGRNTDSLLSPLAWNASSGTSLGEAKDSRKGEKRRKVDLAVDGAPSTFDKVNGDPLASTVEVWFLPASPRGFLVFFQPFPGIDGVIQHSEFQPPTSEEPKVVAIHTSGVSAPPSVAPESESHVQPADLVPTAASLLANIAGNLKSLPSDDVHENAATAGTCCSTALPGCNRSAILPDLNLPQGDWF